MAVSLKLQVTKKKSKCPPKYNWLNMLWYVHKMEEKYGEELLYYSFGKIYKNTCVGEG